MTKLFRIQWATNLSIVCVAAAVVWAQGCTTDDGDDDGDAGAAGDDGGGGVSTGGRSSGGATSGGAAGAAGSEGGAAGTEGGAAGHAGADGSGAGAGGVTGVNTCDAPAADEETAQGKTCSDYCSDFFSTCAAYNTASSSFTDIAECRMLCENFGDAQLCCRAYHVELAAGTAAGSATTHCPHAAGEVPCN